MRSPFPLFSSHLELAHQYWEKILQKGDTAIDATCGNGKDTLKLGQILYAKGGGKVIGLDIQEEALARSKELISVELSEEMLGNVALFHQSHVSFPPVEGAVKLIVYNLGYLPGGDKSKTTMTESTLESVTNALRTIDGGGVISITCYSGHEEGAREEKSLLALAQSLSPEKWNVCHHRWLNRNLSPSLLLISRAIDLRNNE